MSVFVSLSVKAIHLELVSGLTTEAFVVCLRHFIGKWDNFQFLLMSEHWLGLHPWKSPTLGWSVWGCCEELQNTSYSNVRLPFEELATVLIQMEACLNSRLLASIPCRDGIDALMHFLIRYPHVTLPDPSFSYQKLSFASMAPVSCPGATVLADVVLRVFHYSPDLAFFMSTTNNNGNNNTTDYFIDPIILVL